MIGLFLSGHHVTNNIILFYLYSFPKRG